MHRILRVLAACALLLVCAVPAAADDAPPSGFNVVEAFIAAINAGDLGSALALLDADAVGLDIASQERSLRGDAQFRRWITALIADGVQIDTELLAVHGDGSVFVTLEHTRADTIPTDLRPVQGTGTYFVSDGRLAALTRVMLPAHRDAWLSSLFLGRWRCGLYDWDVTSDGRYAWTFVAGGAIADSGRYEVIDGAVRFVSDEASSICGAGEMGTFTLAFSGDDVMLIRNVSDECRLRSRGGRHSLARVAGD